MKAFLLAAGLGTRLRPLTDKTPKCLLPVGGQPLLDIWLDALAEAGVDEVLVNAHHHADQVTQHVARRVGPPTVHVVVEEHLRGSAGTLRANARFVAGDDMFLAINADNLTDFDLRVLIDAHRSHQDVATLALFRSPNPSQAGIVELTGDHVTGFEEKPAQPRGELANAGLYAFSTALLDEITGPEPRDIGYHLLPGLVGRARAVRVEGYFVDIGTPAALDSARREWKGTVRL